MTNNRNIADEFSKPTAIATDAEVSTAISNERTASATLSNKTLLAPALTNIIITPSSTTSTPITINGIASQSGDYLNINTLATGGTNLIKIDVNGNLGLGKTPGVKLDVNGSVAVSGNILVNTVSASGPNLEILNSNSTNGTIAARASSGTDAGIIWAQSNTYYSGPSYTGTGIVQNGSGISGTSYGFANGSLGILSFQNTSGAVIQTNGGTSIVIATNATERMRIDYAGNVGIGTNNPSYTLDVKQSTGQINITSTTGTNLARYLLQNTGGSFQIGLDSSTGSSYGFGAYARVLWNDGAYPMVFTTASTERMRIDSTGSVGIGTSSLTGNKVTISGNDGLKTLSVINTGGGISTAGALYVQGGSNVNTDTTRYIAHFVDSSAASKLLITNGGNVGIGNSSPSAALDIYTSSQTNIGIQSGSQAKFWITAQSGVNTLSIGGNGGSAPTSGAINIDGSGLVTINGGIAGKLVKRITSITDSATPSPNADTTDMFLVTALGQTATFAAPSGTPTQGQQLMIRIKDNGTARTLAWNAIYRASADLSLPTITVASKTLYLGFIYNSTDVKWDLLASLGNF